MSQIESKVDESSSLLDESQLKIEGVLSIQITKNPRNFKFSNDFCQ